ncbi:single-stranded DNA-binding protein [uncultured Ruminococcus sp.]|uniref:single-stranded DNA-binding protein n=1 Tax=uncultured Ruminococcus sp. TaxID=165186 RepID=UPI0025D5A49B|nr:single-stranded DNA-binding protein [uncultured Ruminococcus sp.]
MNKVIISGRMTVNPELKTTTSGKSVCSFNLAVDRANKNDEADFPTVVAWDGTAEFASRYLTKGRKIIVEGHIHTRNYEDRDGNNRKATEIYAEHIEFADSKPQEQGPSEQYGAYR